MKVKVSEATNIQLNWMVAAIERFCNEPGVTVAIDPPMRNPGIYLNRGGGHYSPFSPATFPGHTYPIIVRECILVGPSPFPGGEFAAGIGSEWDTCRHIFTGPTPLIAAMRCFVMSKLGDEVEVPEELK